MRLRSAVDRAAKTAKSRRAQGTSRGPALPPRPPRFLRPGPVERLTVLCCSELRVQLEEERAERKALEKELEACKKQMAEAGLL